MSRSRCSGLVSALVVRQPMTTASASASTVAPTTARLASTTAWRNSVRRALRSCAMVSDSCRLAAVTCANRVWPFSSSAVVTL